MEILDLINRLGSCITVGYVLYVISHTEKYVIYEAFFEPSKQWTLNQDSNRPNF
jgi:hypothetical protein